MDQLRAILMLIGIPYHVGLVYAAHAVWIVESSEKSLPVTWVIQFSHTFRMPVFFLIAGFFSALMIPRRGLGLWLAGRAWRIGIPLLTSLILVSPLMVLASGVAAGGATNAIPTLLTEMSSPSAAWTVHLWFLLYLLIYCMLFAGLWLLGSRWGLGAPIGRVQDRIEQNPWLGWLGLAALGLVVLASAVVAAKLDIAYLMGGIFVAGQFVADGVMFLVGALIASRPTWFEAFIRPRWPVWAVALATAVTMAVFQDDDGDMSRAITYFLMPVVGVLFAHLLLSSARLWLDRRTRLSAAMVEAAMTMYLVHVPIVLWLTVGFLAVGWPAEVEFLLITIITVAASYGFHCLVARHPILVVLFNGQAASARAKGSAIVKAEPSGTRA
ncbi:Glucans biosynthesis protein mdoC [Roseomonas mucosa]|uniref:acyltransferase family protein n=1 Tax=Roseomonas mucosa TaxID=207340 RepID=UPI000F812C4E|nr:acyltransferase family protein [Roseomonas mucosa]MDT8349304.1 acyltransferase family protein [Roseomonas mucosa]UZO97570.1 Glucans biosynthesis protein mdoC [Roseomonas mucosa]HWL81629.1 acyltransferase family protein [Roseomonas sp.]